MNSNIIVMQKKEASDFVWRDVNKAAFAVKPITVYRIIRDGREVDSWVSGKIAFNIVHPKIIKRNL